MEAEMSAFAALDVPQEQTAICVVNVSGRVLAEAKVATCPDAIAGWLAAQTADVERIGMETGPLAVWLWNALAERGLPAVCLEARHANGVLKMTPNKTDRLVARGLAQIGRSGWFRAVQIKSRDAYVTRASLTARDKLVSLRASLENEVRGLPKTFGVTSGKRLGGFKRRAGEIIARDLAVSPGLVPIFEALMPVWRDVLARIADLARRIRVIAGSHQTVRLLMTVPASGRLLRWQSSRRSMMPDGSAARRVPGPTLA
ncbi:transposase [Poseidonocella sp. HB161398]|uniref:IS110 family transposase n=1 Tax=Poseidonocella sp. HB161398 TaxID=2320855 RepID=UPI001F0EC9F8|nr:transposase [Poseidonocella sp. HB161398]